MATSAGYAPIPGPRTGSQPNQRCPRTTRRIEATSAVPIGKQTWPKTIPDQVKAMRDLLTIGPQTADALADHFKRKPTKAIEQVLAALPGE